MEKNKNIGKKAILLAVSRSSKIEGLSLAKAAKSALIFAAVAICASIIFVGAGCSYSGASSTNCADKKFLTWKTEYEKKLSADKVLFASEIQQDLDDCLNRRGRHKSLFPEIQNKPLDEVESNLCRQSAEQYSRFGISFSGKSYQEEIVELKSLNINDPDEVVSWMRVASKNLDDKDAKLRMKIILDSCGISN